MTNKDIQAFVDALVKLHEAANKKYDEVMNEAVRRDIGVDAPPFDEKINVRKRGTELGKQMTIREVLMEMDINLPGSKRMVRRALEKIDPAFAAGYYAPVKKKKEVANA